MRIGPLISFALVVSSPVLAQTQAPDQSAESRYIKACLKEDTEAFCRCEYAAIRQRIKDPQDLEVVVRLEEQTAGVPDADMDAIMRKLPPERLKMVVSLSQQMEVATQSCPDYRKR